MVSPDKSTVLHAVSIVGLVIAAHKFWPKGVIYGEKEDWEKSYRHRRLTEDPVKKAKQVKDEGRRVFMEEEPRSYRRDETPKDHHRYERYESPRPAYHDEKYDWRHSIAYQDDQTEYSRRREARY